MTESESTPPSTSPPPDNAAIPMAVIRRQSRFSAVWIIPFVAALAGAWLGYKTISEQGPSITITFREAEGIEAGKTKIRYKNVEIGQVRSIKLAPDLSGVVVVADLVSGADRYLNDKTGFWIVHARVSAGQVSGLGTLFSGAYIGMDPVLDGAPRVNFTGLDAPPEVTTDDPGRHFVLRAEGLGSLDVGSPVFYRKVQVGSVVGHNLSEKGDAVEVRVFVRAPYDTMVKKNTRFWNAAGIDVAIDANGVRINTESLASIMIGGVAFETPENLEAGGAAAANANFRLFDRYDDINETVYTKKTLWLVYFSESVRGLTVGAPVEFRGIRIGKVKDIRLKLDIKDTSVRIPVLIEIEPGRLGESNGSEIADAGDGAIERLVGKGLRAQLKTGNLLTGQLFVDLDMYPTAAARTIVWGDPYPELPTVPTPLEEIKTSVTHLLTRIEKIPFEELGTDLRSALNDLRDTLKNASSLTTQLNENITPVLQQTMEQTQSTLRSVDAAVKPDSTTQLQLKQTLKEVSDAARSLRELTDYLEQHPESLIKGKTK